MHRTDHTSARTRSSRVGRHRRLWLEASSQAALRLRSGLGQIEKEVMGCPLPPSLFVFHTSSAKGWGVRHKGEPAPPAGCQVILHRECLPCPLAEAAKHVYLAVYLGDCYFTATSLRGMGILARVIQPTCPGRSCPPAVGLTAGRGVPPVVYFSSYLNFPSKLRRTLSGAWFSGCNSNTARSKYCTVYILPSSALRSWNSSVIGKPCCASPPCVSQYRRNTPPTDLPVSGKTTASRVGGRCPGGGMLPYRFPSSYTPSSVRSTS